MTPTPTTRQVDQLVTSQPSQDGEGVRIQRIHDFGRGLDPFLMLDEQEQALRDYRDGTLTG